MSLPLDHGPHTVTVFMEEEDEDSRGNEVRRPAAEGVVVAGVSMQPVTFTRGATSVLDVSQGQRATASWRLIAREAPLGAWSRVEWNGRTLTVLVGPLLYDSSPLTRHVSATLQEER